MLTTPEETWFSLSIRPAVLCFNSVFQCAWTYIIHKKQA